MRHYPTRRWKTRFSYVDPSQFISDTIYLWVAVQCTFKRSHIQFKAYKSGSGFEDTDKISFSAVVSKAE